MCGIFGVIQKEPILAQVPLAMSKALRHRGPDDEGYLFVSDEEQTKHIVAFGEDTPQQVLTELNPYTPDVAINDMDCKRANFVLGHRRLSIQDLSPLGHQPMSYLDRYWIVYNGEVYNHIELKEELAVLGHAFISQSDTEVILAAYAQWGVECLQRFNGMWSFVIYDMKTKNVFMSRDRFGVKPFYYSSGSGKFIFSSEPKAILSHPFVLHGANICYLEKYLETGPHEYLRETAFEKIFRLENAHYIHCHVDDLINDKFIIKCYWKLTPNLSNEKFEMSVAKDYAQRYREILEDAVRLRMRADVEIGAALSGGLDSSSIVYLIQKIKREAIDQKPLKTFSCVYHTPGTENCDESHFIDLVAKQFALTRYEVEPQVLNVSTDHANVVRAMDTPPENSCVSGWNLFRLVSSKGIKVSLDGQGADEQLAGYLGYIYLFLTHLSIGELIKESLAFMRVPGVRKHIAAGIVFNLLSKVGLQGLADQIALRLSGNSIKKHLNQRLCDDAMRGLVTLVHYADRVSMAHSVESRMPFLDYRLAEFLASVPVCYKMHDGWTKYIARLAFTNDLPSEVCWRKDKLGWPSPERLWFSNDLKLWYLDSISSSPLLDFLSNSKSIDRNPYNAPSCVKALNIAAWEKEFNVTF